MKQQKISPTKLNYITGINKRYWNIIEHETIVLKQKSIPILI